MDRPQPTRRTVTTTITAYVCPVCRGQLSSMDFQTPHHVVAAAKKEAGQSHHLTYEFCNCPDGFWIGRLLDIRGHKDDEGNVSIEDHYHWTWITKEYGKKPE